MPNIVASLRHTSSWPPWQTPAEKEAIACDEKRPFFCLREHLFSADRRPSWWPQIVGMEQQLWPAAPLQERRFLHKPRRTPADEEEWGNTAFGLVMTLAGQEEANLLRSKRKHSRQHGAEHQEEVIRHTAAHTMALNTVAGTACPRSQACRSSSRQDTWVLAPAGIKSHRKLPLLD